jgi:hypothetical protein
MSTWKRKMHPCVKEGGEREVGINEGTWRQHPSTVFWGFINSCHRSLTLHICSLHVLCSALLCLSLLSYLSLSLHLCKSYPVLLLGLLAVKRYLSSSSFVRWLTKKAASDKYYGEQEASGWFIFIHDF